MDTLKSAQASTQNPVCLHISGIGHVPSFKNSKMLITRPHPKLITKPEYQKWMELAIQSLESQLRSELATRGIGIMTVPSALPLIASLLPLDDSRKWIVSLCANTHLVSKGEEGADIIVETVF